MDRPHCVYQFSVDGHFGCFQLLAIVNKAAVNIEVCYPFELNSFVRIYVQE